MIKCFFLELIPEKVQQSLRRYRYINDGVTCPNSPLGYGHDDSVIIGVTGSAPYVREDGLLTGDFDCPRDDPRWPTHCSCGYEFKLEDNWQSNIRRLYRRSDTGEEIAINDAPAGALWYANYSSQFNSFYRPGPDGLSLMCKTPGGDWCIDSRCTNCTMPNDNEHYCWVRHGDPRHPETLTVDKNGLTCAAGAGSIQCGNYHGFLQNGYLT